MVTTTNNIGTQVAALKQLASVIMKRYVTF